MQWFLFSLPKLGFLIKDFHFVRDHYGGVYMSVGTLTQSTKSAKHSQFSLRAYKLFYQAIYVTLISSQELPLTVMIANRLGNFALYRSRFYQVLLTSTGAEGEIRTHESLRWWLTRPLQSATMGLLHIAALVATLALIYIPSLRIVGERMILC